MSDARNMLLDTAERMFRDLSTKAVIDAAEYGTFPTALWQALVEAGLTRASVPEALGGAGLDEADAFAVVRKAAEYAAPVPLAEGLLAAGALAAAGMTPPDGVLTLAVNGGDAELRIEGGVLSGEARNVPWGAGADAIVVVTADAGGSRIACVAPGSATIEPVRSVCGDPRADVRFDSVRVDARPAANAPDHWLRRLALVRAQQMAGALDGALAASVGYATERKQFGKTISGFQAIQHQLAVFAGEVAAADRAADGALDSLGTPREEIDVAVAKARVGEAAGIGAEIAHQVHGAMGFTHEHRLHQLTRRLWTWRDEYGSETVWQARLGRLVAAGGADAAWSFIAGR